MYISVTNRTCGIGIAFKFSTKVKCITYFVFVYTYFVANIFYIKAMAEQETVAKQEAVSKAKKASSESIVKKTSRSRF